MFTFSVTDIRVVMMRGRLDAYLNGGFRNPHYGQYPGLDEKPGVWLVGDEGVYLFSNGKLTERQRPFVVYAEECNPKTNPDYWHYKRQHFGADDGIEFLDGEMLVKLIAARPGCTHLKIVCLPDSMQLFAIHGYSDDSDIQRIWRDLNTVASHAFWDWDVTAEQTGRHHFGLPFTNPLV